jgi:excisionase family DNA binding protein
MATGFLTVDEIADWLKVDPRLVRDFIDLGVLPAVHMESHEVRVKAADLERFVATFTRWERDDVADATRNVDPSLRGEESARDRFVRALAGTFSKAASPEQSDLGSQLRALAAAAEDLACGA